MLAAIQVALELGLHFYPEKKTTHTLLLFLFDYLDENVFI